MKKMVNILPIVLITAVFLSFAYAQGAHRIQYIIKNQTTFHIDIIFHPTGNMTSMAPGVTRSCDSPIRNGQFPKVEAHASNGAIYIKTISVFNGLYYIQEHWTSASGPPGIVISAQ